jgi:DtxR family Mn-dependent transcriptional regulator
MKRGPDITRAMEDYLKALFELGGDEVKPRDLAQMLSVAPASVTNMLDKLAALRLVSYQKYRGASLTRSGRNVALEVLRHHRLLETYLAQALGYRWDEVHDEAERLEHVISEAFEERVAELLGDPTHDPHGDPIPRRDGTLPATPGRPLAGYAPPRRLQVQRIIDQRPETLHALAALELRPGASLLLERSDGEGFWVQVEKGPMLFISAALAAAVLASDGA